MFQPREQIDPLKTYCRTLSSVRDFEVTFYLLEDLRLPDGCDPPACDGLLCPVQRDGYPSRLFLSAKVRCPYERNWNCESARIAERNWFAFSWKVEAPNLTLVQMPRAHLAGFTRPK